MRRILLTLTALLLTSCVKYPDSITPVSDFDLDRYLGTWYEIARLDHSFERGLEQVTAEYSLREDGGVQVINRGYSAGSKEWKQAKGKAYFVRRPNEGYLKVSFFGPFYGAYAVFELDHDDYQYAFVSGPDESYLWFLSRTPTVSDSLKSKFIHSAGSKGFNTDNLIFVDHDTPE
jgi:apolipoprotein D and lipocalin family protein